MEKGHILDENLEPHCKSEETGNNDSTLDLTV